MHDKSHAIGAVELTRVNDKPIVVDPIELEDDISEPSHYDVAQSVGVVEEYSGNEDAFSLKVAFLTPGGREVWWTYKKPAGGSWDRMQYGPELDPEARQVIADLLHL